MTIQFVPRCMIGLALSTCMFAQVKPPPGGGGGGATGGRTTNPTQPTIPNPTQQTPDFSQRPLFLSGKVIMEDGTAPPEAVMIQLVCRATPRSVGRTDSKGSFSIDLNNRAAMMTFADASESPTLSSSDNGSVGASGNGRTNAVATSSGSGPSFPQAVGDRELMGCDLQAALPGFRSDVIHLSNRRTLDDPNVGILILHRLANVQGTTISATTAMAPKDAKKAFEKGQNAIKKDKWEEAQKELAKAVAVYPKYAVAWVELGRVQDHQNDVEGARKSYATALEADGKLVTPYLELASLASREQKWQEVSDRTGYVLNLNPVDFPQAYLLNSISNYYLKNLDAAEKSAREGLNHDAEHRFPKMNQVLGVVLAQKHDYEGAAEQLRQYLRYSPNGSDVEMTRKQLAQIEKALEAKKQ